MRGIVAVFNELDATVEAIERLRKERVGPFTVYSPTPRHELEHALHAGPSVVRRFTLIGGLLGASFGYWVAIWTSEYWPMIVGGKPVASWVPYTIISFEMMVLVGALSTVFGMFISSRIPRVTMTVGYDPRFSDGSFGIWVEAPAEKESAVRQMLGEYGAVEVRSER
jgi:hypothetical protein